MSKRQRKKVLRVVTRPLRCEHCRQIWGDDIYESHLRQCSLNPSNSVSCSLCKKSVLRSNYDSHRATCVIEHETQKANRSVPKLPLSKTPAGYGRHWATKHKRRK